MFSHILSKRVLRHGWFLEQAFNKEEHRDSSLHCKINTIFVFKASLFANFLRRKEANIY